MLIMSHLVTQLASHYSPFSRHLVHVHLPSSFLLYFCKLSMDLSIKRWLRWIKLFFTPIFFYYLALLSCEHMLAYTSLSYMVYCINNMMIKNSCKLPALTRTSHVL